MDKIVHLNDIGTLLRPTLYDFDSSVLDVSLASTITFTIVKPDGSSLSKTGLLHTDGTDGIVYYVFATGDLDMIGVWRYRVTVVLPAGTWHSTFGSFRVKE